jgi:hypothetical protein
MKTIRRIFRKIVAFYRLNLTIVCEESKGMGLVDFHNYPDDAVGTPSHGLTLICKRCGKQFMC